MDSVLKVVTVKLDNVSFDGIHGATAIIARPGTIPANGDWAGWNFKGRTAAETVVNTGLTIPAGTDLITSDSCGTWACINKR